MSDLGNEAHRVVHPTAERTSRHSLWIPDATSLLTVFVVLVFLVPAGFVVGFLGAAGRPAMLVGVLAFAWWAHETFLTRGSAPRGPQPVRRFGFLFFGFVLVSYIAAFIRPIDGAEGRGADRGLIMTLCMAGLLLLAADGIPNRARLDALLQRLATGGAILAAVGILQFFTAFDLAGVLQFPGLTELTGFQEIQVRSDLNRVAATASHPIEFGVVLAMIFPFALHYALHESRFKKLSWLRVGLIAAAIPMSVARSGTLALFVAFAAMWFSWPARLKIRSLFVATVGTVSMRLLIPGLLGTIRSLFTNILYDPSTQGRTEDYGRVGTFIGDRPWVGRGFFTFLPEKFFVLDNQYLGLLIELGILGTVAFLLTFAVAIRTAWRARNGSNEETRSLSQAHVAALLAIVLSAGTFDMLAFPMVAGVAFLLIGCSGALWRITASDRSGDFSKDALSFAPHLSESDERTSGSFATNTPLDARLVAALNRLPRVEPRR